MAQSRMPKVTVLMAVYNGEKHLREAIESILGQTFRDFEFLIIDDGSTDSSREIIASCADPRIRLVRNEANLGLTKSLNRGLKLAAGEYVARMDADDVSLPERLERQVKHLDEHPEVGVCGAQTQAFGDGIRGWISHYYLDHDIIKAALLIGSAISHPTAVLRKAFLDKFGLGYDEAAVCTQDYDLWVRCADRFKMANLPDVLLRYRRHAGQVTIQHERLQNDIARAVTGKLLARAGISASATELEFHEWFCKFTPKTDRAYIWSIAQWLSKIFDTSLQTGYFSPRSLQIVFFNRWLFICYINLRYPTAVIRSSWSNSMFNRQACGLMLPLFFKELWKHCKRAIHRLRRQS